MNLLQSGEEPISLDPRWLVEGGDFGLDERGFWARPFADDVSLLRIDLLPVAARRQYGPCAGQRELKAVTW